LIFVIPELRQKYGLHLQLKDKFWKTIV